MAWWDSNCAVALRPLPGSSSKGSHGGGSPRAGYQKYARLRFVSDPDFPGQSLNDVRPDQPELPESSRSASRWKP